ERAGVFLGRDAHHRAECEIGAAGFDVLARGCGFRAQVHHRNAVNDRKNAAMAPKYTVADRVRTGSVKQRRDELQAPAAVRAAKNVQKLGGNVTTTAARPEG